jgi:hypothetical protein
MCGKPPQTMDPMELMHKWRIGWQKWNKLCTFIAAFCKNFHKRADQYLESAAIGGLSSPKLKNLLWDAIWWDLLVKTTVRMLFSHSTTKATYKFDQTPLQRILLVLETNDPALLLVIQMLPWRVTIQQSSVHSAISQLRWHTLLIPYHHKSPRLPQGWWGLRLYIPIAGECKWSRAILCRYAM